MNYPRFLALALLLACPAPGRAQAPDSPIPSPKNPTIVLSVDATDVPRKLLHASETIPVRPGPLTLVYPKWIPGEHGPTGPVDGLAGLTFRANGQTLRWRRDLLDMYAFHLNVPPNAHTLDVSFDFLLSGDTSGFSSSGLTTPNLVNINWNQLLLYPQGRTADGVNVQAMLRLPPQWRFGTALPQKSVSGPLATFDTVPLVTLIDSPVLAGIYYKSVTLTAPGVAPSLEIDMAGDSAQAVQMPAETLAHYKSLVTEAETLFGAHHFRAYHFLYTLSDNVASFGLEHHESSDDRVGERGLLDEDERTVNADLLPHEFVHSWNGKFRRPADLTTPDYQKPMQTDLLWVYEGLTQYYGKVLSVRSGLWTPAQFQSDLAALAAKLDHSTGRQWRPLQDTADDAQVAYNSSDGWANYRRGTDFYDEGVLIWLEADTLLRQKTAGKKSLDDFCRAFYGGPSGLPRVVPYTFDDVVKTLNAVAPYDWRAFFTDRLNRTGTHAPLGGIANSGWRSTYTDTPSDYSKAQQSSGKFKDFRFSLGLTLDEDGKVGDVTPGMPAAVAGLGPGLKIIAVNGRRYSNDTLEAAVKASSSSTAPLELITENGEFFHTFAIDYHSGLQYPHLERTSGTPDLLSAIAASRTLPAPN